MCAAAGTWKMTSSGIMPAMIPSTVALASRLLAYSTIGLPRTIWKESALNVAKTNALAIPGGNVALPGCSVEISGCTRVAMILRLSRYRLTGQYFERPRELSSRFGPEPDATDANHGEPPLVFPNALGP